MAEILQFKSFKNEGLLGRKKDIFIYLVVDKILEIYKNIIYI